MTDWSLLEGDVFERLAEIETGSVHCCITSPPYYHLRSYLPENHPSKAKELGNEPTVEEYIENQVRVFREVRRAMHHTGLLFINIGDSRNASSRAGHGTLTPKQATNAHAPDDRPSDRGRRDGEPLNVPWRLLDALRADGWRYVQEIVWVKPSVMPESVQGWRWERCRVKIAPGNIPSGRKVGRNRQRFPDVAAGKNPEGLAKWAECPGCPKCEATGGWVLRRGRGRCTTSHEYVLVFAASDRYFWNSAEFREPATPAVRVVKGKSGSLGQAVASGRKPSGNAVPGSVMKTGSTRNPRTTWQIGPEPSAEHHFAAFPSELARLCILAGTSSGGCCPVCGTPWAPMVDKQTPALTYNEWLAQKGSRYKDDGYGREPGSHRGYGGAVVQYYKEMFGDPAGPPPAHIVGYRPCCECGAEAAIPCLVLDPYAGTGTVLQVARHLGRRSIGIELNPDYIEIARRKIPQVPRCFQRAARKTATQCAPSQRTLF